MATEDNEDPILAVLDQDEHEDADWEEPEENPDSGDHKDDEDAQFRRAVDEG
jgi:hypothetical protein